MPHCVILFALWPFALWVFAWCLLAWCLLALCLFALCLFAWCLLRYGYLRYGFCVMPLGVMSLSVMAICRIGLLPSRFGLMHSWFGRFYFKYWSLNFVIDIPPYTDRMHKWRPRNYSFVFVLIILTSLTLFIPSLKSPVHTFYSQETKPGFSLFSFFANGYPPLTHQKIF